MSKRLEISEALSTRTVNELSEKEKMIQEQAKLIEEEKKEGSSDALRAKDKEIMGYAEKLEEEVLAHAEIAKMLEESGVLSTRAMKKLSEKQKLIQEQSRFIVEKDKESKENMAAVKAPKEEKSVNKSMSLISRTEHLMQLPVMMSKNTLIVVKIGIGFHNFRHNNIQILNFNLKILASPFLLFVECLIVNGRGDRIRAIGSEESPSRIQRTAG